MKPEAYVASIQKNGYTNPLFTERGEEIRDPVKYVLGTSSTSQTNKKSKGLSGGFASRVAKNKGTRTKGATPKKMFKADGTPIKNPKAYVDKIKTNGYTEPLFTEGGDEIRDPVSFLAKNGTKSAGRGAGVKELQPVVASGMISYYGKVGRTAAVKRPPQTNGGRVRSAAQKKLVTAAKQMSDKAASMQLSDTPAVGKVPAIGARVRTRVK